MKKRPAKRTTTKSTKRTRRPRSQAPSAASIFATVCIVIIFGLKFYRSVFMDSPEERERKSMAGAAAFYEEYRAEQDMAFGTADERAREMATQAQAKKETSDQSDER